MIMDEIKHFDIDAIGADPIVGGCLVKGLFKRGFLVRAEEKDHGKRDIIIGSIQKVDDVSTTGKSLLMAIDTINNFGGQIIHVITILDRGGEISSILKDRKISFTSLLTLGDLGL